MNDLWKIVLITLDESYEWIAASEELGMKLIEALVDKFALIADENVTKAWYSDTTPIEFELYFEAVTDIISYEDDINIEWLTDYYEQ